MAMALMVDPVLLLLDEPSAGLAPQAAERLFETIRGINADGVSIAMVEQNALEALAIAGRGYILVDEPEQPHGSRRRAGARPRGPAHLLGRLIGEPQPKARRADMGERAERSEAGEPQPEARRADMGERAERSEGGRAAAEGEASG